MNGSTLMDKNSAKAMWILGIFVIIVGAITIVCGPIRYYTIVNEYNQYMNLCFGSCSPTDYSYLMNVLRPLIDSVTSWLPPYFLWGGIVLVIGIVVASIFFQLMRLLPGKENSDKVEPIRSTLKCKWCGHDISNDQQQCPHCAGRIH